MLFRQLFDTSTNTYTYLLADSISREAIIIDSVLEQVKRDIALLNELDLSLRYSLDTHVHADHITGSGKLREKTACKVGLSSHAAATCADLHLKEGDIIRFGIYQIHVLETPGHTNSCLSFVCEQRVMTGDALMIRACGRTDFQQGDASRLYASIHRKLYTLPDETQVFPAHDYKGMTVSTIAEEKAHNPRLRLSCTEFVEHMNHLNLPQPKRIHVAVPANMRCGCVEA